MSACAATGPVLGPGRQPRWLLLTRDAVEPWRATGPAYLDSCCVSWGGAQSDGNCLEFPVLPLWGWPRELCDGSQVGTAYVRYVEPVVRLRVGP